MRSRAQRGDERHRLADEPDPEDQRQGVGRRDGGDAGDDVEAEADGEETKTRLCRLPEESFDFLGYTIGRCYSPRTGEAYIGPRPSRKSIQRFCREISELTERRWAPRQVGFQVAEINRKLKGWANYFRHGTVRQAYRLVDNHLRYRLRRWLKAKSKVRGPGEARFPKGYLYEDLGLYSLRGWAGRSPCAKA